MRLSDAALCASCVLLSSVGQVLLRAASLLATRGGDAGLRAWLNATSLLALAVYAAAMLLWLWALSRVPLTQAFAFFGLSFFVVPVLANRFLGDPVSAYTWIGAAVIAVGIVLTNWRTA